jgi:hypothetical protein
MRMLRTGIALAVLAVTLCSCWPFPWSPWGGAQQADRLVLIIKDNCRLVHEDGTDVQDISLWKGRVVRWKNLSQDKVVVRFTEYKLFGRWSITLPPGGTYKTVVRSTWAPAQPTTYPILIACGGADGPTPPVKEEPPPN